jgi:hypothetical protein
MSDVSEETPVNRVYAIATTAHGIRYTDNFLSFNDEVQEAQNEHGQTYAGDFENLAYEMTDNEFCTQMFDLNDETDAQRWEVIQTEYGAEWFT